MGVVIEMRVKYLGGRGLFYGWVGLGLSGQNSAQATARRG
jgi:hypothetical protein